MSGTITPQVVGLGQCCLDILGQTNSYPELDQKTELDSLLVQGGGPVATALVTLARLGVPVAIVGAVGDDEFGRQIHQGLVDERVDCTYLVQSSGASSQVAFISVDDDGRRNIFWHRGTATLSVPKSFQTLLSDSVRILHLDGLHFEPVITAAEMARSLNVVTVLDAGTFRPGMEKLLPLIDHLVVSEKFARQVNDDPEVALKQLADYRAEAITITLGNAGSLSMSTDGQIFRQPAFAVDVVDTTGCGDVFHGGYIYGLLQNWSLPEIVRFAAACAALKTRSLGGRTAIPALHEVESFLQTQSDENV